MITSETAPAEIGISLPRVDRPHSSPYQVDYERERKTFESLLLGWNEREERSGFGFIPRSESVAPARTEAIEHEGDGHLMTIAPTGAGKGVGALIPNLLRYPGSAIVVDPKGENCQVTARRRREMGQQVVVLDPFRIVSDKSDSLNPMDLLSLCGSVLDCDSEMIASQMAAGHLFSHDPYWNDMATPLTAGLIAHVATSSPKAERNLNKASLWRHSDNVLHSCRLSLQQ